MDMIGTAEIAKEDYKKPSHMHLAKHAFTALNGEEFARVRALLKEQLGAFYSGLQSAEQPSRQH